MIAVSDRHLATASSFPWYKRILHFLESDLNDMYKILQCASLIKISPLCEVMAINYTNLSCIIYLRHLFSQVKHYHFFTLPISDLILKLFPHSEKGYLKQIFSISSLIDYAASGKPAFIKMAISSKVGNIKKTGNCYLSTKGALLDNHCHF